MRRRAGARAWAVALGLALSAAACGGGDGGSPVSAAGEAADEAAEDPTTTTTSAPTTTTTTAAVAEALPVATTSVTVPKVRLPVVTTTTAARPKAVTSPLEPGTERWGNAGLGVHRVIVQGPTRLDYGLYLSDAYDEDFVEVVLEVHDEGVVRYAHVDFGDGQQWEANFYYSCDPQTSPYAKPNPIFLQTGRKRHAMPGAYTVTATVKTVRCAGQGPDAVEVEPNTITSTLTAHRHAGKRPQ